MGNQARGRGGLGAAKGVVAEAVNARSEATKQSIPRSDVSLGDGSLRFARDDGPVSPAFLSSWALSALIVALAIAQQAAGHLNGDNSWFILFAERVANGAKAYVDISDPNPPAGFLVYMPAVYLARATGLPAEFWTVAQTFVLACLSLALSGALLWRADLLADGEKGVARNAALWVLLFSVGFAFAEREHFALIAFLPFAAAMVVRAEQVSMSGGGSGALRVVAGVCGGVSLCFKPYFALPLAAVVIFACVRRRFDRAAVRAGEFRGRRDGGSLRAFRVAALSRLRLERRDGGDGGLCAGALRARGRHGVAAFRLLRRAAARRGGWPLFSGLRAARGAARRGFGGFLRHLCHPVEELVQPRLSRRGARRARAGRAGARSAVRAARGGRARFARLAVLPAL